MEKKVIGAVLVGLAIALRLWAQHDQLFTFNTGVVQNEALAGTVGSAVGFCLLQLLGLALAETVLIGACIIAAQRAREPLWPWWVPAAVIGVGAALLRTLALHDGFCTSDEFAYHFQAQICAGGELASKAPPVPPAFACPELISYGGHWAAQYPVAWSLLLGVTHVEGYMPALLAAGSVAMLCRLAQRWYGAGWWCGVLALASATLMLNAATLFPHVAVLFWSVAAVSLLENERYPWLAGPCAGLAFATRFVDGGLLVAALLVARPHRDRRGPLSWGELSLTALGFALTASLVAWQDRALTGNPWLGGYQLSGDAGRYLGETLADKLKMLSVNLPRMLGSIHPLWLPLIACVSLHRRDRRWAFCAALSLGFLALYCRNGGAGFGARFHLVPCVMWLPVLAGELTRWQRQPPFWALILFAAVAVYPCALESGRAFYVPQRGLDDWFQARGGQRSLLLFRQPPHEERWNTIRNSPYLEGQVRALFLDAASNEQLRAAFSSYQVLVVDASEAGYDLTPYEKAHDDADADLYWAAVNELKSVVDPAAAMVLLARIPAGSRWAARAEQLRHQCSILR